jgi:flagellar motor switch protein FliM
MPAAASLADVRSDILERLVGETGEPDRITAAARKFALRALGPIAENVNELLSFPLEIELETVDLGRFGKALANTGERNAVVVAPSAVSPDAMLFDLDVDAISLLVSAFLGGDEDLAVVPISRALSRIETEIANKCLSEVAQAMNGHGPRSMKLGMPLAPAFTGQDIGKQVLRDGPSVRMVFAIKSPTAAGRLSVTMPQRVLLNTRGDDNAAGEEADNSGAWSARLGEEVRRSSVTLDAIVPLSQMTLGALSALKVGQILEMPAAAKSATRLASRNKTLFMCEFGKLGQNYSIRITHPFDEHQDFVDRLLAG